VIVRPTSYVPGHVTVTEKRAPTDESVRLLREMEDKAEQQVVEAVKVGDAVFECVVHMIREPMSLDTICRAIFSLNGKQISVDSRTSDYNSKPEDVARALVEAVSRRIAEEIVLPSLRGLMGRK
jgi:hypothetical protein